MINCKTIDCVNINRKTMECKLDNIEVDDNKLCLSYGFDMKYFKQTLRDHIRSIAPSFNSLDPSTQDMVIEAKRRLENGSI